MPTTVKRPLDSPVSALRNSPDRISEARFCCHSWVSANFAVMASLSFSSGFLDPRHVTEIHDRRSLHAACGAIPVPLQGIRFPGRKLHRNRLFPIVPYSDRRASCPQGSLGPSSDSALRLLIKM